jgi:hypothetical protein
MFFFLESTAHKISRPRRFGNKKHVFFYLSTNYYNYFEDGSFVFFTQTFLTSLWRQVIEVVSNIGLHKGGNLV